MRKLLLLIQWEFKLQNKIYNQIKYISLFVLLYIFEIVFISVDEIEKFLVLLPTIFIPMSLLSFIHLIFRDDISDGMLETMLSSSITPGEIIISKYCSVLLNSIISAILYLSLIYIMFNLTFYYFVAFSILSFMMILLISSLLILIGSVQSYFRSNNSLISLLLIPLMIPSFILTSLAFEQDTFHMILMTFGINCIIIPVNFLLSGFLIKNIYNF
ncbi:MAG: ABC transporter permease [Rickettsiaceae bacterium]